MRKYARIAVLLVVLIAILLISPIAIGLYLKRHYQAMFDDYNNTHRVSVHVEHFKRGWFYSVATLRVKILDPTFLQYFNALDEENRLKLGSIIVEQRIQHGPIFYLDTKGLPYIAGLAAIHNTIHSTEEINNSMKIIRDLDYISFLGNHYKYFKIAALNLVYPRTDIIINIDDVECGVWLSSMQKRTKGDVNLKGLVFHNPDAMVFIPRLNAQFDGDINLWLGNNILTIPSMLLTENGIETLSITDLTFKSFSEVVNGFLSGNKKLTINQINIGGYLAGPFYLDISASQLNAKTVNEMMEAYKIIQERGELYQSQLRQKILMLLPGVLNKQTAITLNNFDLKTQDGQFHMDGKFSWSDDQEIIPDRFMEILSAANAKLDLKIAKQLMNRWIDIASTLPWFSRADPDLDQAYDYARYEMMRTMQLNAYGVLNLVREGKLKDSEANAFIAMQKMNVSTRDYSVVVKELLLNKIITQETSYILLYLYVQGQKPLESVKFLLQESHQAIAKEMSLQLDNWIKHGYIKQQDDNYVVSLLKQKKRIKINGKWLP